jgi:hypothetical protein
VINVGVWEVRCGGKAVVGWDHRWGIMEARCDSVALDMDIAPWGGQVWRFCIHFHSAWLCHLDSFGWERMGWGG